MKIEFKRPRPDIIRIQMFDDQNQVASIPSFYRTKDNQFIGKYVCYTPQRKLCLNYLINTGIVIIVENYLNEYRLKLTTSSLLQLL